MMAYYAAFWIHGEKVTDFEEFAAECPAFYAYFEEEIWRMMAQQAEEFGHASIPEFMAVWTLREMKRTLAFYEDIYADREKVPLVA